MICWATSALLVKAYTAAHQAGVSLPTMEVLQACKGDLLKELHYGKGLSTGVVKELRRATDLTRWSLSGCYGRKGVASVGQPQGKKRKKQGFPSGCPNFAFWLNRRRSQHHC